MDWDDASDQELVTLLGKYGYNDALTIEKNNVTINDNGETETLIWDSAAMDFTVDVDMFVNGPQKMFFRTVDDGGRDVTVLVDADGKAIQVPSLGDDTNVLFAVANNGTEIDTIMSGDTISREGVINACGGYVNVSALDAGAAVFLLVKGSHVQFWNGVDLTTTPSVLQWLPLSKHEFVSHPGTVEEQTFVFAGTPDGKYVCTDGQADGLMFVNGQWMWASQAGNLIPADQRFIVPFASKVDQFNGSVTVEGVLYTLTDGVMTPAIE